MTIFDTPQLFPHLELLAPPEPVKFCACTDPQVVDRLCTTCQRPNLVALLAWEWCSCETPDLEVHGLRARTCGLCGNPPRAELLNPTV